MATSILALLEDPKTANQVEPCLQECGHEVFVVDSFSKAIELLSTRQIDLILSDVHLENGGNVFDFLRRVKKEQHTSEIPFVLLSSKPTRLAKYLADGVRTAARYLGAIKYIEMETFNCDEFKEHINRLLPQNKQAFDTDRDLKVANKVGD